jgi:ABC-type transport system involved in Fe-S cluster assembly fused permease/ATPase subunit
MYIYTYVYKYFYKLLSMADIRDLLIKRVRAVSEMANALSFIESLPDGFNTEVSVCKIFIFHKKVNICSYMSVNTF